MSTASFKIAEGICALTAFEYEKGARLSMTIDGADGGFFKIGEVSAEISRGAASFELKALPDGRLYPTLITKSGTYQLPSFDKLGVDVHPNYPTPEQFRLMGESYAKLSERLFALEDRLLEISEKVYGPPLLEFAKTEYIDERIENFENNEN